MLKRILLLTLILNTAYVQPSNPPLSAKGNLGFGSALLIPGIMCVWLAHKEFKKVNEACKEVNSQLLALNAIGVTVRRHYQMHFIFGIIPTLLTFIKLYSRIKIPANLSQQQKKKAKEIWSVLLANQQQYCNSQDLGSIAAIAGIPLIAAGVALIVQAIQSFQLFRGK